METIRIAPLHLTALCALLLPGGPLPAAAIEAAAIEIGSVSELDLKQMRELIDGSEPAPAPAPAAVRALGLGDAVRVALEHNLELQIATLDVDAQARELTASEAFFHPTVGAQADGDATRLDRSGKPAEFSNTYTAEAFARQELPTGGSFRLSTAYFREDPSDDSVAEIVGYVIEGRQPLMRGGRIYVARRPIEDAGYDLEIERARLRARILQVGAETKAAYYRTVLAERLIEILRAAIARDEELLGASQALFEAGRVNRRDVLSAEIQLAEDSAGLASRRGDLEVAQNRLRDVLGLPIDHAVQVVDRTIPFRPIEIELASWIERALDDRPELLEVRKQLQKSDLDIRNRRNDVLPTLDLFGLFRQDFRFDNRNWRAGVLMEIPFGNVAARNRLARARTLQARIEREYAQRERQIELEVREIEIRLRADLERIRARTAGVESARGKRELAEVRFQLGLANNFDITDADEDLVRAESDLLQSVVEYATNLAFLEARIAGPL